MSRIVPRLIAVWGAVVLVSAGSQVYAQFGLFGRGYDPCACAQPVVQPTYQTVPVTEYQQVKQTVRRPVVETKYVEQPVTEYVPVTEQKTAEIPQVTYQNVTEYQTVQRDRGQWVQQIQCKNQMSPCQYDPRPGMAGWFNRTGYNIRQAFTPRVRVSNRWQSNIVAEAVPVTRQVAVRTTRKVTYNVTRMVPKQTTRRVAVNTVRYVDEEVTAMRPVTVMRQVPIGSRVAYTYGLPGASQTVLAPSPDPISQRSRTADSRNNATDNASGDRFQRDSSTSTKHGARRSSYTIPQRKPAEPGLFPQSSRKQPSPIMAHRSVNNAHGTATDNGPLVAKPSVTLVTAEK